MLCPAPIHVCFFSLCAWALEELQVCEEFAEWSELALEPWYETQLVPDQQDAPESNEVAGCEVRLVYKALHMLPHVGASYVMSLFEDKSTGGGYIVRAFDRAKRDAFWLSLSKSKLAALGENATRSPAALAAALTRRLKLKSDARSGKTRLVFPPAKKVEPYSDKKGKNVDSTGAVNHSGDVAGVATVRAGEEEKEGTTTPSASASPSSPMDEPATPAALERPEAQAKPRLPRRSHPPPMRGSKVEDLGPLVESEKDASERSAGELRDKRSVSGTDDGKDAAVVVDEHVVDQLEKDSASGEMPVRVKKCKCVCARPIVSGGER